MNRNTEYKIVRLDECVRRRKKMAKYHTVGLAHGCFDVLTPSHVKFLRDAARNCINLIVSVSSDEVAKRLKGPDRPTFCLEDRLLHVASFEFVSYVVVCDDDDASSLIKRLSPVILMKGHDSVESTSPGFLLEKAAAVATGGSVMYVVAGKQSHSSELIASLGQKCLQSSSVE
jgi:D-beta-D-heptose 7-phosphate kinase/D-beta-D-heptose 1-phosphate adenosyltransferase